MRLGVNIDHIAVLREARAINEPNPMDALGIAKLAGASQITIHLREDRRHIDDRDARLIIENSLLPVNLECSINEEIIDLVCKLKPYRATLVPENREEVTTEGGLDVYKHFEKVHRAVQKLHAHDIETSLFIDPKPQIAQLAQESKASMVEFHTGEYANIYAMLYSNLSKTKHSIKALELSKQELQEKLTLSIASLDESIAYASAHFDVALGHGLNYENIDAIAKLKGIDEFNIGQSIIARSVFVGLERAIKEMLERLA